MSKIKRNQFATMNIQYKYYPFTKFLEDTVRYGYENIEFWGATPHFYPDDMSYRQIMQIRHEIESRGLKVICYTPEQCVYPVNLASEHREERQRSLRFFEDSIRAASELGTDQVLITSGTGYYDGSNYEEAWKYAVENIRELGHMAKDYRIHLALEVLRHDESNLVYDLKSLKRMVEEIDMESVCANVDTIPMALADETLEDYIKTLGNKLIHVHFIDGAPRGHLAWGDGILNLESYLKQLDDCDYSRYLTLEITDGRYYMEPWKSLEKSAEKLFGTLGDNFA